MSVPDPRTVADLFRARADDPAPGLVVGERTWSWREVVAECDRRAEWLREWGPGGGRNVGLLLDNGPDYLFSLGAVALSGHVAVALNSTRSSIELAGDLAHTDVALVFADRPFTADVPVVDVETADWSVAGEPPTAPRTTADDLLVLMFTSGSTARPKAVRHSHRHLVRRATGLVVDAGLDADSTVYLAMPMFHAGTMAGLLVPAIMVGATIATRPRFSASNFAVDVRRFGATHTTFVGRTLHYILAQDPEPEPEAGSSLRVAIGNGAADADIAAFAARFGCRVVDVYGTTEGAISLRRGPDNPPGSLGIAVAGDVRILDPRTGRECPRAVRGPDGEFGTLGPEVGEMVRVDGPGNFEGYWNNPEADAERLRDGRYWSGDLAWRDEAGNFYFAGRAGGMVRVDGENLSPHRIETAVGDRPEVGDCVVFAVPDPGSDDALMIVLTAPGGLDPATFFDGLVAEGALSRKEVPRFVRVTAAIPRTATQKLLGRGLQGERWHTTDPVWWRPDTRAAFRPLTAADAAALDEAIRRTGRPLAG
ncbi:AMP-binding protein [Pseudonocardia sp. NPDC049154]|uniref:AMP-binding protein n=1 Tax=Pseudonocardia sp. NPDC049154 TaxID=3155501 RepID=UPI003409E86F